MPTHPFSRAKTHYHPLARSSIQQALSDGLRNGQLTIREEDTVHKYGIPSNKDTVRDAEIEVVDPNFWVRVYLTHDLGCKFSVQYLPGHMSLSISSVAEAYMHGDFNTPGLKAILDVRSWASGSGTPMTDRNSDVALARE